MVLVNCLRALSATGSPCFGCRCGVLCVSAVGTGVKYCLSWVVLNLISRPSLTCKVVEKSIISSRVVSVTLQIGIKPYLYPFS